MSVCVEYIKVGFLLLLNQWIGQTIADSNGFQIDFDLLGGRGQGFVLFQDVISKGRNLSEESVRKDYGTFKFSRLT